MATAADIKAFAPEFAAVADGVITTWIGFAPGAVGGLPAAAQAQATILYVCHNLTRVTGGANGTAGAVTSRTVGDVTTANSAPLDVGGYKSTGYGLALHQLMRRYSAGGEVV